MSDQVSISYSYSTGSTSPGAQQEPKDTTRSDDKLYAFEECTVVRLPTGGALLVHRHKPRQTGVSHDVATALEHCKQLRTLRGHAEFLTGYMPELGGDVGGVLRVLEQMRDAGVLTEAGELVAQFQAPAPEDPPPAPSRAFIYTCDRPEALQRLLQTLPEDADLGLHERLYVVDDSRQDDCAARNRALVEGFNRHNGAEMVYFGLEERGRLIDGLIEGLPECGEAIRFLLDQQRWYDQKTYGSPRSLCQLLSVGCRVVMMDDDILCRSYDAPQPQDGVAFRESVIEAQFYPSDEAWLATSRRREEDPLAGHLTCLGHSLPGALRALGLDPLNPMQLAGSEVKQLRGLDDGSRVLVTQCGTYGDPGTGDMSWILSLQGASLERFLTHPAGVKSALENRSCWLGHSRLTLSRHGNMSGVTGLDNTTLLPPYVPAWRGEDAFFAFMVQFLYPNGLAVDYPWAVPHLPLDSRAGTLDWHGDTGHFSMLWNHIRNNLPDDAHSPPEHRLARLVQLIRDVAATSDAGLSAAYRAEMAAQQVASARQVMDHLRNMPVQNAEWQALLEMRRHRIFEALGRKEVPITALGQAHLPEAELLGRVRNVANDFAGALAAWPRIRQLARSIVG